MIKNKILDIARAQKLNDSEMKLLFESFIFKIPEEVFKKELKGYNLNTNYWFVSDGGRFINMAGTDANNNRINGYYTSSIELINTNELNELFKIVNSISLFARMIVQKMMRHGITKDTIDDWGIDDESNLIEILDSFNDYEIPRVFEEISNGEISEESLSLLNNEDDILELLRPISEIVINAKNIKFEIEKYYNPLGRLLSHLSNIDKQYRAENSKNLNNKFVYNANFGSGDYENFMKEVKEKSSRPTTSKKIISEFVSKAIFANPDDSFSILEEDFSEQDVTNS